MWRKMSHPQKPASFFFASNPSRLPPKKGLHTLRTGEWRELWRREMTNETKAQPQAKPDLKSHYRPLGLKAVAAAALMLKRKPVVKPA